MPIMGRHTILLPLCQPHKYIQAVSQGCDFVLISNPGLLSRLREKRKGPGMWCLCREDPARGQSAESTRSLCLFPLLCTANLGREALSQWETLSQKVKGSGWPLASACTHTYICTQKTMVIVLGGSVAGSLKLHQAS